MPTPEARIARDSKRSVMSGLLRAKRRFGGKKEILIDADGRTLTYTDILRGAYALGHAIAGFTKGREKVGVLLPTSAGAVVAFFACQAYGRVPAMLNFTAGPRNLDAALRAAEIKVVLTAHAFVEQGGYEDLVHHLSQSAKIVYLEDVRENLTAMDKAFAVAGLIAPWLVTARRSPKEPGVVLFTSGTEGDPKGVVLSHENLLANVSQVVNHVTLETWDVFYNPLPVFHSYGLTAGTLLPIMTGLQTVLHPSPLQVRAIPKRIRETQATILVATDSFLQQYARASGAGDLSSLRYAVCGAERVRDETRAMVKRRFDLDVLEGYGVTEAAPVIAVNQPGDVRPGTVGKMLPSMEIRMEPVDGLEGAGRLFVRGPNVMLGYLSVQEPGKIRTLEGGWHDTGDVVSVDDLGYVTIRDRVKRFAKIGGEMVSLTVVENNASAIWPNNMHAAISLPDERKGEQIILVTDKADADHGQLLSWCRSHGVSLLAVPKRIIQVESIPLLGTGKINHVLVKQTVKAKLADETEKARVEAEAAAALAVAEAVKEAATETIAEVKGTGQLLGGPQEEPDTA